MTLTIGSLFAGIGGLELGLERGIGNARTIWQVEKNEYCRAVLAKHWPDATRYEDVRHVGRDTLAPVDVICGGFPCPDISYAGKGAGLAGERSGLWYEYARIIRELRPKYVVVENVRALLTRGLDAVLGTLADCGYDAEWGVLSAAGVGAPHLRERIFILAYPNADVPRLERWERAGLRERAGQRAARPVGASLADTTGDRCHLERGQRGEQKGARLGRGQSSDRRGWSAEPDVGRVAHGVPARVDRLRALGNAVVPQVAEVVGRLIAEREAARRAA